MQILSAAVNLKNLIYFSLLILLPRLGIAQQVYVRGEVTDEQGKPLPNAAILQHSTRFVFYSGGTGGFGVLCPKSTDSLTFSMDGYQSLKLPADAAQYLKVVLKRKQVTAGSVTKLASLTQNLTREWQQPWLTGDETYVSLLENGFVPAAGFPSTGVRLNIDRASYSNVRRFLKMSTQVPPDAVRIEEMLNYFNFRYEPPPAGQTFAIRPVLTECPWNAANRLMFVQVASRQVPLDSLPPTHLTFLIDVSGSMDMPNRLPLLKTGFRSLVQNLRPVDSVSIVVYGGSVGVWMPTTGGDQKEKIFRAIDSLEPGGATPGEAGVKLAYRLAQTHFIRNGNNRVILATDGDFNVGLRSESDLEELITKHRQTGIYLTCLGVGMGNYKDSKIQALAQKGHGNFAYIDSYAEAEKVLLQEFMQTLYTVADNASFTVQFDPSVVQQYRLVGFDNKVGAFRDSLAAIEGGEIGSAYSSVLIFEVEPATSFTVPVQPAQFQLLYRLPNQNKVLQVNEFPRITEVPWAQLNREYQLAGSVALFGMLLRNSRYTKNISWDQVMSLAAAAADKENKSQQEFLEMIKLAKGIYGKKKRGKG
ncbi:YfbK domain-containing protein [Pseudocnuella soli]|uniref:YfbK domain-containing protein n=1 Tax=Pseudocnuella soli TaxID=2502779 RepID=UPI00104B55C0|nr:von Willebrand factor type A domain-containing protein [Pseudocnuella soli]